MEVDHSVQSTPYRQVRDEAMTYWWRPYIGWGRRQFVVGIRRNRRDRICPEHRFIRLENELW